ncbi:MAG: o-succinylbenzoate synthase [Flavobacteriales bacterium]
MIQAQVSKQYFRFKRPAGTSRGVMFEKESYFITLEQEGSSGLGECSLLRGLSVEDVPDYEKKLHWLCQHINDEKPQLYEALITYPSIYFGLEQAFLSLERDSPILFPSDFTDGKAGILINGLIWMGSIDFMQNQLHQKISQDFACIKLKIGALSFEEEYRLLKVVRQEYPKIELRVDANEAFSSDEALEKLSRLAAIGIHSIEQPIRVGQWETMAMLCRQTPLPIALDEELIGLFDSHAKQEFLNAINPQYLILKPSLCGGFQGTQEWITAAKRHNIGWWITSALESDVGLSAIAQWTYGLSNPLPQGLGTGALYTNNVPSPLIMKGDRLWYDLNQTWDLSVLNQK